MKALTLHRPWAHAVAHLGKPVENRTWPLPSFMLGQRCAIHAGKTLDKAAVHLLQSEGMKLPISGGPGSCIVATARFVGCFLALGRLVLAPGVDHRRALALIDTRRQFWFVGPYGWIMDELRVLPEPVPCKGAQGFWNVPSAVENEVARQEARWAVARIDAAIATIEGRQ